VALLALSLLVAAGCGDDDSSSSASGPGEGVKVTLADKGFAESFIVAQAYSQALAAQGFDTSVKSLGSSEIADKAIRDGEIDVYPEYIGTSWQTILKIQGDVPTDPTAQFDKVKTEYAARGLTALAPSQFSNGNALACTKEAVDKYHITDMSSLGPVSKNLVYSANAEHLTRPDGLPLLEKAYGIHWKDVKTVDISLRYKPIEDGQADCVYAFGTDPDIGRLGLVLIDDDKGQYAKQLSFQTFPVVNTTFYEGMTEEQRTAFTDTLNKVSAALTQEVIVPLISQVQFDKEDPEVVAAQLLQDAGITEQQ
jgi:osmoprotectant transport system substrate-binding protein